MTRDQIRSNIRIHAKLVDIVQLVDHTHSYTRETSFAAAFSLSGQVFLCITIKIIKQLGFSGNRKLRSKLKQNKITKIKG